MRRVDDIPGWMRPAFWLYGYGLGWSMCALVAILRGLCRVRFEGLERCPRSGGMILAFWHRHNFAMFVSFLLRRHAHVCMNHPAWFMKPVHVVLRFQGTRRIVLGSTGSGGREAADEVVGLLKEGHATFINPDGPAGPPRQMKKGVLHMALQSGVPIVPVDFRLSRGVTLRRTWDHKAIPLPFSRITVRLGRPIAVTEGNFERWVHDLPRALDG